MQNSDNTEFKSCPSCHQSWKSRDEFLADTSLELVGYQVHFKSLEQGLFLFNHLSCKSTISVKSGIFFNLYHGPVYKENLHGSDSCPEYCLFKSNLESCPAQCDCGYVREIMQIIKTWVKKHSDENSLSIDLGDSNGK